MKRLFVRAKIHRATVTDANLNYKGSISLDPELISKAGLRPYEFVHVNNVRNGVHWETYVIPGEHRNVVLNGPPAHHFQPGDKVIIFALAELEPEEIESFVHTCVYVTDSNDIFKVEYS
jgi:aspartate 1-decarboxylase